ncbi:MAG: SpvB/TcaC N-terminal domain-containing protein, partial [Candidatus Binatia bacterium]
MKAARSVLLALLLAMQAFFAPHSMGQAVPGNAPGSQTGDSGGAFTGLASAPEANLFTGVAQTTIPIEVPPGRLGLAPTLALTYSSSGGAGAYGNGWNLPLPRIHRSTREGVPRYDDSDRFVLEMPGAMVELEPVPGSTHGFRAEIESAFLRVGFDQGGNSWTVIDKLGVTFRFGSRAQARTGRGASRNQTFSWLLESIEDPAGNRIEYEWAAGGAEGTSTGLPAWIRYGANARTGAAHFAEVEFRWVPLQHPAPPRVSSRDGYAQGLDVRLATIDTRTHGLAARSYVFSHEEDAVTADLRLVGVTLTAFAETPADDVRLPSTVFVYAPALHEGWPALGTPLSGEAPFEVPSSGHLRLGSRSTTIDNVDLNGDGIIDRVATTTNPPQVSLGHGRGFGAVRTWNWPASSQAPREIRSNDGNGNLLSNVFDLDGDGFADLVDGDPAACAGPLGHWCMWKGSANGFASEAIAWRSLFSYLRETTHGGSRVVVDLIDVDSDGRLDLVDATQHNESTGVRNWFVYRNTGAGFESPPRPFAAPLPYLSRSSGGRVIVGLFDINADSLPDMVIADAGNVDDSVYWFGYTAWEVHLHDGNGLSPTPTVWPIDGGFGDGPGLPNFLNLRATDGSTIADLFDITGDGRPDLVRRNRGYVPGSDDGSSLCKRSSRCATPDENDSAVSAGFCCFDLAVFVNTGSSFSQPVGWSSPVHGLRAEFDACPYSGGIPCSGLVYDFDFFDFDGDGLVDFIERYTAAGKPNSWLVHPHPASPGGGGARPNLLVAMRNGVGGETMLRYDSAATTPDTRLPFPHWIVTERELRDSVFDQAPLLTSFAYRGGYFDPVDRELRGFATVQEVDPVGTIRVREYHQDRRRAGRLRRVTNLPPAPCVAANAEDPADPCSPWRRPLGISEYEWPATGPVLLARESDVPYQDGTSVENLRRSTGYSYDAYGNVIRRRTDTAMASATTTTTEYHHRVSDGPGGMPGNYLVAKPTRVLTQEDGRAAPLLESRFEYEWKSPAPASLVAASTCVSWTGTACSRWSRRTFEYDAYGNVTLARGPDGAASRTYHDANALFAERGVDPVGLVTRSTTDPRTGQVTETIAPGGSVLRSRYDGLGRLLRTWGPGTTRQSPRRRVEYAPGGLGQSPPRVLVTDAERGQSATFFDGLGRGVGSKAAASNGDIDVAVVSGLKRYDTRGLVDFEALPFDSADLDIDVLTETFDDAPAWMRFGYDAAGRLVETTAPDGSVVRVDRSVPGILQTHDANRTSGEYPGSTVLEFFDGLGHRLQRDSCSSPPAAAAPFDCPPGSLVRRESWRWDGLGRATESRVHGLGVAAGDSVLRVERDGLGNRSSVVHSDTGAWRYRYDDSGRLVEVLKPDGARLATSYDAAGRVRRRRGPGGSASYAYHGNGGGVGKVRRVTTRARGSKVADDFGYDARGRVVTRKRRIALRSHPKLEFAMAYRYDDLDRRVATEYVGWEFPGEGVVNTRYDAYGREVAVWTDARAYVLDARYDSSGRLRRIDYGNGLSDLVDYEDRSNALAATGRLRCLRTTATGLAASGACASAVGDLEGFHYDRWDRRGNLLAVTDALRPGDARLDGSRNYEYDALGRLVSAYGGAQAAETFAFDPVGNLLRNGNTKLHYNDPAHPARLTAVQGPTAESRGVEWDDNGRRRSDGEVVYDYDGWDRLVSVAVGEQPVSRNGYTDSGERFYRQDLVGGETEFDLGDGVVVRGGAIERSVAFAGRVVATDGRDGLRFLHRDHQASVKLISDEAGGGVERSRYATYGRRVG